MNEWVRQRRGDLAILAAYLAAIAVMGWFVDERRDRDIQCLRATLTLAMDASVRSAREGGVSDAARRAQLFDLIKREALEPRACPSLDRLRQETQP